MYKLMKLLIERSKVLSLNPKIAFIHSFIQRIFIEHLPGASHHVEVDDHNGEQENRNSFCPKDAYSQ